MLKILIIYLDNFIFSKKLLKSNITDAEQMKKRFMSCIYCTYVTASKDNILFEHEIDAKYFYVINVHKFELRYVWIMYLIRSLKISFHRKF